MSSFFPKIAVAIGVLTSSGRGMWVATFAEGVMLFGRHGWVPCLIILGVCGMPRYLLCHFVGAMLVVLVAIVPCLEAFSGCNG